jgi:hypothetical protein
MAVVRSGSISPRLLTKAAVAESSAVVRPPQIYTRRIRLQSGKSTPPTRSGRGWPAGFISRNAYAVPTTCDRPIAVTNCVFAIAITLANHGWLTPAALDCKPDAVAEVCFPPVQRLRSPRLAYASRSWLQAGRRCRSAFPAGATVAFTTAGLPQPLLVHGVRSLPKRYLRWTNAHSQERRASTRRGSVNGTLCRENGTLSSGWRAQDQERRALARRGSVNGTLSRENQTLSSGWRAQDQERRALARRGSVNGTLSRENRTLSSGWRAQDHERRASARRGSVNRTLSRENRTLSSGWRAQDHERRALACRGSETCWRS